MPREFKLTQYSIIEPAEPVQKDLVIVLIEGGHGLIQSLAGASAWLIDAALLPTSTDDRRADASALAWTRRARISAGSYGAC